MRISKVSFSDILRNDYLDHLDTFGENFDFDIFKKMTLLKVYVLVDADSLRFFYYCPPQKMPWSSLFVTHILILLY